MVNTINPADCDRTTVYTGECRNFSDTEWITFNSGRRRSPNARDGNTWLIDVANGSFWMRDDQVRDLVRLIPARPVTRKDLPSIPHVFGNERNGADKYREAVIEYLNAIGGVAADDARWRRAHEIVERERDQARQERDEWKEKCLDTDEALHRARASLHEACKVAQSYKVDAYQATERAEAAEARTAPAVTRDDIEKAIRGKVWAANRDPNKAGFHRVHIAWATDSVWSLVSGADPAVHVVRESDVAAVEVRLASDGWYADGAWLASADETAEWVRDRAAEMVVCAARNEAVAHAIEQDAAADPLLDKAQEFAALADWELTDREAELLHTVAAHVLGQEDRHVDQ